MLIQLKFKKLWKILTPHCFRSKFSRTPLSLSSPWRLAIVFGKMCEISEFSVTLKVDCLANSLTCDWSSDVRLSYRESLKMCSRWKSIEDLQVMRQRRGCRLTSRSSSFVSTCHRRPSRRRRAIDLLAT